MLKTVTVTAENIAIPDSHLQELPEERYAETDLWTVLDPENRHLFGESWSQDYRSITFPVEPGEQLYSKAFGEKEGFVTFFDANGSIGTLTADEAAAEFAARGYITVPEGANAVCVTLTGGDSQVRMLNWPHVHTAILLW